MTRGAALVLACAVAAGCGDDEARPDAGIPADAAPFPDADPDGLPDLALDGERAAVDLAIEVRGFATDACELHPDEDCLDTSGDRTLLRFSVETPNLGTADLALGSPIGSDDFLFSDCHGHYHLAGYAVYELRDAGGQTVATGRKQAFCLEDSRPYLDGAPGVARFHCLMQGIQRGWSDVYHSRLPCQFVDVTDLPAGDYVLRVAVDAGGFVAELDEDNNAIEVPVTLGDPALLTPTEPCPAGVDPRATSNASRECGWELAGTWTCTPGAALRIGCAQACSNLGACTGDPMIRVCEAGLPAGCSNAAQVEPFPDQDDACGSPCPRVRTATCPPGGELEVYVAPERLGEPFTCDIELEYL